MHFAASMVVPTCARVQVRLGPPDLPSRSSSWPPPASLHRQGPAQAARTPRPSHPAGPPSSRCIQGKSGSRNHLAAAETQAFASAAKQSISPRGHTTHFSTNKPSNKSTAVKGTWTGPSAGQKTCYPEACKFQTQTTCAETNFKVSISKIINILTPPAPSKANTALQPV